MYHIITPAMQESQKEANEALFRIIQDQARKKEEAKNRWQEAHPPCPHCGRKDELPPWLT